MRVVECDPSSGKCQKDKEPLFAAVEPDAVSWPVPQDLAPGQVHSAHVYFDVIEYDTSISLFLRCRSRSWSQPDSGQPQPCSDYATDAYGDAWDFDEGDLEGIDQWGNKPSCVRNRQVKDGVLSFEAWQDAYFIWGDMWGSGSPVNRPVNIDLRSYPVLKMKVRQSCPSSEWEIFVRSGSPRLLNHKFRVSPRLRRSTRCRGRRITTRFRPLGQRRFRRRGFHGLSTSSSRMNTGIHSTWRDVA